MAQLAPGPVDCSAIGPASADWPVTQTPAFAIRVPSDYRYQAVATVSGVAGRWIRRPGRGQSIIDFFLGPPYKRSAQQVVSSCKEIIGGQQAQLQMGINQMGDYVVQVTWLKPLPSHPGWYLELSAFTASPAEQLEALSAIRSITLNAGA